VAKEKIILNKENVDVQVLQSWMDRRVGDANIPYFIASGAILIKMADCSLASQLKASKSGFKLYDCGQQLQQKALLPNTTQESPVAFPFLIEAAVHEDGTFNAPGLNCSLVEIRTLTKEVAIQASTFKGLGFGGPEGLNFTPKEKLHQVGIGVSLRDGSRAVIHRFIAVSRCVQMGSPTFSPKWRLEFKPYALYEVETDEQIKQYRAWEASAKNHLLGGGDESNNFYQITSFDRQKELLLNP
jgi:hypothetical protein